MEKSSFAMAKFGLETKEAMPKRDCGFYLKYIFLFTSLIQFLIILGLVLFMVYGNAQAGTDTYVRRLKEQLQEFHHKSSALSARNANLTRALNATLKDRDKLQGLVLKVQRDLDKCNSSQSSSSGPQMQEFVYNQLKLVECKFITDIINSTCKSEKAELQKQLDTTTSSKKELEKTCQNTQATLAKTAQEQKRCEDDLKTNKSIWDFTKVELDLQKQRSTSLENDISNNLLHITDLVRQSRCREAEAEVRQVKERVEELFRRQQDRDTWYTPKKACEVSVDQCHLGCSRDMQELSSRLLAAEKRVTDGQEEKKKLQAEKEQLGKALEEKRKEAAAQVESQRELLSVCMGTKV
ncbi:PLVAP protein, partial [Pitta sordida]|nr:PLVAP protein [Pitta sordida]